MHDVAKPIKSKMKSKREAIGIAVGGFIAVIIVLFLIKELQIGKMMSTQGHAADRRLQAQR